jgi:hypothetical protein
MLLHIANTADVGIRPLDPEFALRPIADIPTDEPVAEGLGINPAAILFADLLKLGDPGAAKLLKAAGRCGIVPGERRRRHTEGQKAEHDEPRKRSPPQ